MVDLPISTWLSAGLVFLAVALGTLALALAWEWWRDQRRKARALDQLRDLANRGPEALGDGNPLFRSQQGRGGTIQALIERVPRLQDLDLLLQQAGMKLSVQSFVMLCLGLGMGLGLAMLIATRLWSAGLIAAILGTLLPYMVVRRRRSKRMAAFEAHLPETIDLLTRAIRAGHPLSAGLKMVSEESPDPISTEFRRTFEEQRFGLPIEDSLMSMSDRVGLVDVRILATAILIQRNVGGNLAEILDNLAYTIRERFKIRRQLRVYTAQGRLSGFVLGALPIAVGSVIFMLNPKYILLLFTDPLGKAALGLAVVLQIVGFFWIRKIIDIEI